MRHLWVVEASWCVSDGSPKEYSAWHATVGVELTRTDGRDELKDWQRRNPSDRFRLRRYLGPGVGAGGAPPPTALTPQEQTIVQAWGLHGHELLAIIRRLDARVVELAERCKERTAKSPSRSARREREK